eukprot:TRINITY_DN10115_c0_g1_i1.p1 TRINITY_DN10115_c0_g1~~TRINITY_DN10115_c0_g1_i1.p1  ORF type:complete len:454 (-),score=61.30 TRINITY_DN10115_c0_g1_i1:64-1425(-)
MDGRPVNLYQLQRIFQHYFASASEEEEQFSEQTISDDSADTDILGHDIDQEISYRSAYGHNHKSHSLRNLVKRRTLNGYPLYNTASSYSNFCKGSPLNQSMRTNISQRMIPNHPSTLAVHTDCVFCGNFSEDGEVYMSGSKDEVIRFYDTKTWNLIKEVEARDISYSIISCDFSPDKQWAIYSSWSDYVHMVNVYGEHEKHEALNFEPEFNRFCLFSVQFSPDSQEILGGSSDKHLYIYDIERGERVERIFAHDDDVNTVTFADKSSSIIYSGSDDAQIKVWDRRDFNSFVGVLPGHLEGITFIDSKGDGRYLISNGKDQCIKLWDIRKMMDTATAGRFPTSNNRYQYRHHPREHSNRRHINDQSVMTYRGHEVYHTLIRCRFSPIHSTGQKFIYTGSYDRNVYVYDIVTGQEIATLEGHRSITRDVSWHPYEPVLLSASWDGSVVKWTVDEK